MNWCTGEGPGTGPASTQLPEVGLVVREARGRTRAAWGQRLTFFSPSGGLVKFYLLSSQEACGYGGL